jgi:hypothetical protein
MSDYLVVAALVGAFLLVVGVTLALIVLLLLFLFRRWVFRPRPAGGGE